MGKMERDINKLCMHFCPEGVDYYKLGELGKFYGGLTGKNKSDFSDGNAKFISYRNVYNNPALKLDVEDKVKISSNEKQNTLERGDIIFTGSSETADECGLSSVVTQDVNEKIYLNSFCFIFRFKNPKIILPDFSKHLFRSEYLRHQIGKTASGVTRFNVSKKLMANVTIPLPPLPIQQEIVRILDTFTNLTAELTDKLNAELTARRKQYEYYRDELLTFGEERDEVVWQPLGEICNVVSGGTPSKKISSYWENGTIKWLGSTVCKNEKTVDEVTKYITLEGLNSSSAKLMPVGTTLIALVGATIGKVAYLPFEAAINQNIAGIYPKDTKSIDSSYLYYACTRLYQEFLSLTQGQKLAMANLSFVRSLKIPVPPMDEQKRIAEFLDKFNAICSDLRVGLPAEITARQKQYEYYRDRLFIFRGDCI